MHIVTESTMSITMNNTAPSGACLFSVCTSASARVRAESDEAFISAVSANIEQAAMELLPGADVNVRDSVGRTAKHWIRVVVEMTTPLLSREKLNATDASGNILRCLSTLLPSCVLVAEQWRHCHIRER